MLKQSSFVKLVFVAIWLSVGLTTFAQTKPVASRPNVIFILIDDLRHDGLSATGHPYARTPNIDRIAKAGTKFEQTILNADLAPTLIEFTNAPKLAAMHGRSWLPLLKGQTKGWRETVLLEYFAETNFPRIRGWQAVRTPQFKYIHYTELEGMDELYDLKADPYEMKNLINEPKQASKLKGLQAELQRLLIATK